MKYERFSMSDERGNEEFRMEDEISEVGQKTTSIYTLHNIQI